MAGVLRSFSKLIISTSSYVRPHVQVAFVQRYRHFYSTIPQSDTNTASITFDDRDGDKKTVQAKYGELLLDVAKDNDIDLEGACEGTLSCSTCHLIFDPQDMEKLDLEPASDEELDMLDLAYGLTDTLGCQIEVTEKFDGITLKVPEATRDARD